MKYLIAIFILTVSIHADYLNTKDDNHCAIDVQPYQNNTGICYHDQNMDHDDCNKKIYMKHLIDGYVYNADDGTCLLKNDLRISNLTANQWDYLLAIIANVLGFTMMFLINFLAVLVVRK